MAQYTIITAGNPITLSDNTDTFRLDVRGNKLYFDQEITATGFGGVKGTDWETIDSAVLPDDPGLEFRVGSRGGYWWLTKHMIPTYLVLLV